MEAALDKIITQYMLKVILLLLLVGGLVCAFLLISTEVVSRFVLWYFLMTASFVVYWKATNSIDRLKLHWIEAPEGERNAAFVCWGLGLAASVATAQVFHQTRPDRGFAMFAIAFATFAFIYMNFRSGESIRDYRSMSKSMVLLGLGCLIVGIFAVLSLFFPN